VRREEVGEMEWNAVNADAAEDCDVTGLCRDEFKLP